jgi:hypothetical protein
MLVYEIKYYLNLILNSPSLGVFCLLPSYFYGHLSVCLLHCLYCFFCSFHFKPLYIDLEVVVLHCVDSLYKIHKVLTLPFGFSCWERNDKEVVLCRTRSLQCNMCCLDNETVPVPVKNIYSNFEPSRNH